MGSLFSRSSIRLQQAFQALAVRCQVLDWPPVLSHSLFLILGTLFHPAPSGLVKIPDRHIVFPLSEERLAAKLLKPRQDDPQLMLLATRGAQSCRLDFPPLKFWKVPASKHTLALLIPLRLLKSTMLRELVQGSWQVVPWDSKMILCHPIRETEGRIDASIIYP